MSITHSKSRSHRVLEAIILSYAEEGSPIGSEFLWEQYRFDVSPATIRNVMAELEIQGLITHPHTSAGRVPTDLGYRYYVDVLMEPLRLNPDEELKVEGLSRTRSDDPLYLLEQAAETLSELTQDAAVVLVPHVAQGTFLHVKLLPISERQMVAVLVTGEGLVKHANFSAEEPLKKEEMEKLESFLNQELSGMPLDKVFDHLKEVRAQSADPDTKRIDQALQLLQQGPFIQEAATLILEGTSNILRAPEFRDMERTRRLLLALENQEDLVQILLRDLGADDVKLHIGLENKPSSLQDCTIAAAPYRSRMGIAGAIGVLGPTRMNYPRVTSLVARIAQAVTRALQERE